jgi:hypothetical protein
MMLWALAADETNTAATNAHNVLRAALRAMLFLQSKTSTLGRAMQHASRTELLARGEPELPEQTNERDLPPKRVPAQQGQSSD